jgi:CRP/FNR family cyclic AMP-dependent transcriptional regulator
MYDGFVVEARTAIRPAAETLASVPLFAGLDAGDALFVVISGTIKITLPNESGDEAILATLRNGDVFGELALLDGAPRSATAVALEATETFVLPRERFRQLIASEPTIRDALLASLARELRRLTSQVEDLHFLDVTGRLASQLLRLSASQGRTQDDGSIRLASSLTQGDLAAMVGCTRQSVNKLLGMFTDARVIRLDRDAIVIRDVEALERLSHR